MQKGEQRDAVIASYADENERLRKEIKFFKELLPAWAVIGLLALALIPPFFPAHESTRDIKRSVLVQPDRTEAKMYLLDANITTTKRYGFSFIFNSYQYQVNSITWPDGGKVTVGDCTDGNIISSENRTVSCDFGNQSLTVRVVENLDL